MGFLGVNAYPNFWYDKPFLPLLKMIKELFLLAAVNTSDLSSRLQVADYSQELSGATSTVEEVSTPINIRSTGGGEFFIGRQAVPSQGLPNAFVAPMTFSINGQTTDTGQVLIDCNAWRVVLRFNSDGIMYQGLSDSVLSQRLIPIFCP